MPPSRKRHIPKNISTDIAVSEEKTEEVEEKTEVPSTHSPEAKMALSLLSPKKAKFVLNIVGGMKPAYAWIDCGCTSSRKVATAIAGRMLRHDEKVREAISTIRADMVGKSEYSFQKFMDEMDSAIEFARETKNATALVRGIELKGKASGHIV